MGALRRVGFGQNDYLVEFEGEVEGARSAAVVCDKCGQLGKISAQEDGGWATVLETAAGDHVRRMAVEEGRWHGVRIKFGLNYNFVVMKSSFYSSISVQSEN